MTQHVSMFFCKRNERILKSQAPSRYQKRLSLSLGTACFTLSVLNSRCQHLIKFDAEST